MRQLIRANGFAWRLGLVLALAMIGGDVPAQEAPTGQPGIVIEDDKVQLDFNDVELSVVIDTIARLTNKNFIYDDRVRGRVTIVSPTSITLDEAYAVFESVLQVKGFTVVEGPGGALKVIPIREAKESNIETVRGATPDSDRFITRLIPLRFIDAEAITNTLKVMVSNSRFAMRRRTRRVNMACHPFMDRSRERFPSLRSGEALLHFFVMMCSTATPP